MKKPLKFFLQFIFSLAVLWWLGHQLGGKNILETFQKINAPIFVLCIGAYLLTQILSAYRWVIISRIFAFHTSFMRAVALYFLGMFYNIFLPSGYGGDVIKALYHAKDRSPPSKTLAALTVIMDRLGGLVALLVLGGLSSLWLQGELGRWGAVMSWIFAIGFLLAIFLIKPLSQWRKLPRRLRFIFLTLRFRWRALMPVFGLSLVIQMMNVAIYTALFYSIGVQLHLAWVCFGYCVVTLATLLPISVGGLGVREGGWAALMLPFGVAPQVGVTVGLLYFFVQTLCSILGLVPFFTLDKNRDKNIDIDKNKNKK